MMNNLHILKFYLNNVGYFVHVNCGMECADYCALFFYAYFHQLGNSDFCFPISQIEETIECPINIHLNI